MVVIIMYPNFEKLGKYQVKDMNVYIEPLIDELIQLWHGITMYDITKPIKKKRFQCRGMLVWTIHDAPGLTRFFGM